MNVTFNTQRLSPATGGTRLGAEVTNAQMQRDLTDIIESPAEQSWTDFCRSLNRTAFLLGDSVFSDLEQA